MTEPGCFGQDRPFGSFLELPLSDGRSHIRANQERIIADARDTEAENRLPVR